MQTARTILESLYLDWRNNYLSVDVFAEHHGITKEQTEALLKVAKDVSATTHPGA